MRRPGMPSAHQQHCPLSHCFVSRHCFLVIRSTFPSPAKQDHAHIVLGLLLESQLSLFILFNFMCAIYVIAALAVKVMFIPVACGLPASLCPVLTRVFKGSGNIFRQAVCAGGTQADGKIHQVHILQGEFHAGDSSRELPRVQQQPRLGLESRMDLPSKVPRCFPPLHAFCSDRLRPLWPLTCETPRAVCPTHTASGNVSSVPSAVSICYSAALPSGFSVSWPFRPWHFLPYSRSRSSYPSPSPPHIDH